MTSPNFRPEDVKVGTIVKLDNGEKHVVVSLEGLEGDYFEKAILGDGSELWLDQMFPVVTGKYRGATRVEVVDNRLIVRLNSIEERLTKLEGSAVKVEFAPDGNIGQRVLNTELNVYSQPETPSPKVCPVSGMFLEEPEEGQAYFVINDYNIMERIIWGSESKERHAFDIGNCFATREDAERYAKHLKVMAKLRRLGGGISVFFNRTAQHLEMSLPDEYPQLTPEEQNALLWPNEEK